MPAWGSAVVEASEHPGFAVGNRYFGFLPMSTDVTVRPAATATGFILTSPHRDRLDDHYRRYRPPGAPDRPPGAPDRLGPLRAVVRTAYPSSFVLADLVATMRTRREPLTVVLSSASSKTALGTAERLAHEP